MLDVHLWYCPFIDSLQLDLKTEADLALTTSSKAVEIFIKDANDKYVSKKFTQSFQIRKYLDSPIHDIQAQVKVNKSSKNENKSHKLRLL